MTKTYYQYLLESEQTYKYRVKVAGGCDNECLKELETKLAKFDLINMSSPKTTPVMEDPLDFPGVKNMEVCMFEIEIAYPAGQDALYDMIEGCTRRPKSQIKVVSEHFAQSYEENEGADPEEAPILEKDYDEQSKEAGEAYADPAKVVPETPTRFKIAGGNTPKAQTTNDLPMGDKSAMGSVKPKLPNVKSFAR
jgi:hypothetical protein